MENHSDEDHLMQDHFDEGPPWRQTILTKGHPEKRPFWQKTTLMGLGDQPDERPPWWVSNWVFNDAPTAQSALVDQTQPLSKAHFKTILIYKPFPKANPHSILLDLQIRKVNPVGSTNPQSQTCWIYKSTTSIMLDLQIHKVNPVGSINPQSQSCRIYKSTKSILLGLQIHKVNHVGSTNPQSQSFWVYKSMKSILLGLQIHKVNPFGSTNPQSQSFWVYKSTKSILLGL